MDYLKWNLLSTSLHVTIVLMSYVMVSAFGYVPGVCPPAKKLEPCKCHVFDRDDTKKGGTLWFDCTELYLGDEKISQFLFAFISTPDVSPLRVLNLNKNNLTQIPDQIRHFTELDRVDLGSNEIKTIEKGSLNFTRTLGLFTLNNNKIITIAPGALSEINYGEGSYITLDDNNLTRFDEDVFLPILEAMEFQSTGTSNTGLELDHNPFDCESDHCHLAWLIRDNQHLIQFIRNGKCSNGKTFEQLESNSYNNCQKQNATVDGTRKRKNSCPSGKSISPCKCSGNGEIGGLELDCTDLDRPLGDVKISQILNIFLKDKDRLGKILLRNTSLSKVPEEIGQFTRLAFVDLQFNKIRSIKSGAFKFPDIVKEPGFVDLGYNPIGLIEGNAFQGQYIKLSVPNNILNRFESSVFQPVLEKMWDNTNSRHIFLDIPVECSDICHLSWLLGDPVSRSRLLPHTEAGACKNGTKFEDLDLNGFNHCGKNKETLEINKDVIIPPSDAEEKYQVEQGDILTPISEDGSQSSAHGDLKKKWVDAKIPYIISNIYSKKNDTERQVIEAAMKVFHDKTCIRFVPLYDESDFIIIRKKTGEGCSSYIGRQGKGGQSVLLNDVCLDKGTALHELMHAAGFWHEQSRPDRNDYVKIHWDNIIEEQKSNFRSFDPKYIQLLDTPYDTESVMHYPSYNEFAIDRNKPTLTKKDGTPIGMNSVFSKTDIMDLNRLYNCPKMNGCLDEDNCSNQFHFGVETDGSTVPSTNTIRYQSVRGNASDGMDADSGVFTTPATGAYYFTFSGVAGGPKTKVQLNLNGAIVGSAFGSEEFEAMALNVIIDLKMDDKVSLVIVPGGSLSVDHGGAIFTGRMIPNSIYFHVTRNSNFENPRIQNRPRKGQLVDARPKTLTFNQPSSTLNVDGGGMNVSEGVFTAPMDGDYHFAFNGLSNSDEEIRLKLTVNRTVVASAWGVGSKKSTLSLATTVRLSKGDCVSLQLDHGFLRDDSSNLFTHFIGYRIEDEDSCTSPEGVHFHIGRESSVHVGKVNSLLEYEERGLVVVAGSGLDVNTGVFMVPQSGTYQFTFSGLAGDGGDTLVELTVNGERYGTSYGLKYDDTLWIADLIDVKKGDKVAIRVTGALYDSNNLYTHFTGQLVAPQC